MGRKSHGNCSRYKSLQPTKHTIRLNQLTQLSPSVKQNRRKSKRDGIISVNAACGPLRPQMKGREKSLFVQGRVVRLHDGAQSAGRRRSSRTSAVKTDVSI